MNKKSKDLLSDKETKTTTVYTIQKKFQFLDFFYNKFQEALAKIIFFYFNITLFIVIFNSLRIKSFSKTLSIETFTNITNLALPLILAAWIAIVFLKEVLKETPNSKKLLGETSAILSMLSFIPLISFFTTNVLEKFLT